ncbi:fimbrial protein [Aeromonas piscicola]
MNKMTSSLGHQGRLFRWRQLLPVLILPVAFSAGAQTIDLTITGTVVLSACTLVPEDKNLTVDLQTLNSRDLDMASSAVKQFLIHLEECDISALKSAKVTIKGLGAAGKIDQLALNADSVAKGFAIGFKQGVEGTEDLALNTVSDAQQLTGNSSQLVFGAYAQKLDGATITPGAFSAKATVEIVYQ